jgi:anti-sigma factor RsiW
MSDCPLHPQLNAYHDGELDGESASRVSEHVRQCNICRDELAAMEGMTRLFAAKPEARMLPLELSRLHQHLERSAISRPAESEFLRTAGMLSALAASILVISAVWLAEFPSRHAATLSPGVAVVPAADSNGATAIPDWERTALTLRVEPSPLNSGIQSSEVGEPQMNAIGLADAGQLGDNSVDAQVADWMIAGLSAGGTHANP